MTNAYRPLYAIKRKIRSKLITPTTHRGLRVISKLFEGSCHIILTIVPLLLALPVAGMGFDSCITFGVNKIMVEFENKRPFLSDSTGLGC